MRNVGIIAIIVGVGVIFISIFFSSKYHPKLNLIGNIHRMEIVLDEGRKTKKIGEGVFERYKIEGKVAIPLKYPFSLAVLLILFGIGIVLSKRK